MAERTYTEQEIAVLLERAAERQALAARRSPQRPGLTLAELEQVAAEAGIAPEHLQAAASELDEPARPLAGHRSGTTATHIYTERWVPGELTPEAWEDVVAELRHRFDTSLGGAFGFDTSLGGAFGSSYGIGTTEQIGRMVEWKHTSLSGIETRVMIGPRGDQLRIRLTQRVGFASSGTESVVYGGLLALFVLLVSFIGAAATDASGFSPLIVLLVAALVAIPAVFVAERAWRQKKHQELEDLADWVAGAVAASQPAGDQRVAAAAPEATASEPRLALPEDDVPTGQTSSPSTRVRT